MKFSNGDIYEGTWANNMMNGNGRNRDKTIGVFTGANGDAYNGEWKDNVRNGKGECKYANGDKYEGDWTDGITGPKGSLPNNLQEFTHILMAINMTEKLMITKEMDQVI